MRAQIFCAFVIMMFTPVYGEEEEQKELRFERLEYGDGEVLRCFHCDLGFWDVCYTTETNCSHGERCYTGRGSAVDLLDVKTLGCARAEECGALTSVELFPNNTVYVMTKHCCDTPLCNLALGLTLSKALLLPVAVLTF